MPSEMEVLQEIINKLNNSMVLKERIDIEDAINSQYVIRNSQIVGLFILNTYYCGECREKYYNEFPEYSHDFPKDEWCGECGIRELTDNVQDLKYLEELYILDYSDRFYIQIPDNLCNLKYLEKMYINAPIEKLPQCIGNLKSLQSLTLINTDLYRIPPSLGNLSRLKKLVLKNNNFGSQADLCKILGNLNLLEVLDLSDNTIYNLSYEIGNLKSLKILNLSRNPLKTLPNSFKKLHNLNELNLDNTFLADFYQLSDILKDFKSLIKIGLDLAPRV